ncbi:methyltransferase domain-containing protein [Pseudonocardia nematodicida]|uniref:Methyltransferase domain-containing protein n=1 Tax=Pseudonocardia nematodicida TaxID=1206997 RepID=A0ABV1KHX1_9PSEU
MRSDGDVLDPVLHRLRADPGPTAAEWCRAPGASSRVRATVAPSGVVLEARGGSPAYLPASPTALPVRPRSVDRIALPLVLPLLPDMDGLFAEMRRVLAPHGLLSLMVPAPVSLGWRERGLTRAVRGAWRHRSAVEHPEWLASSADFAVLADDRLGFVLDVPAVDGAGRERRHDIDLLCRAGVYPPDLPDDVRDSLAAHRSAAHRVRLRRIVARR